MRRVLSPRRAKSSRDRPDAEQSTGFLFYRGHAEIASKDEMPRERIDKPNYTQFPNVIIDEMMADMSESEFRVVMAVCRKTFGWQKTWDRISISQIESLTGLSHQATVNGIKQATERGIIEREPIGQGYKYRIAVYSEDDETETSQRSRLEPVNVVDRLDTKLVNVVDIQKKVSKEKKEIGAPSALPSIDYLDLCAEHSKRKDESGKSTPRSAEKQFVKTFAPVLAAVLGHSEPTRNDIAATRRAFGMGFNETWLAERLAHYANGGGEEFRNKPGANGFWVLNKLDDERANKKQTHQTWDAIPTFKAD